nr:aldehyde dehydrogenase family protein [Staphylococcus aureus]
MADKIKEHREALARLETLDTGKTLEESYADMDDIHNVFMYFAGLADKDGGEMIDHQFQIQKAKLLRTSRCSYTNYTLELSVITSIMENCASACYGLSLVMKPSEITPLTTIRVFELMEEVGFPKRNN